MITFHSRGLSYRFLGEYNKAIADFNKSIKINPKNADVYFNRSRVLEKMGEYSKSKKDLRKSKYLELKQKTLKK